MKHLNNIVGIFISGIVFYCSDEIKETKAPHPNTQNSTQNISEMEKTEQNFNRYWPEGTFAQYFQQGQCVYIEKWIKTKDNRMMEGNYIQLTPIVDTLFRIWAKLYKYKDNYRIFYQTSKQPNDIEFVLSKNDKNVFIFENPFHTFPSIMKYSIENDSVYEVLERGFEEGREKEVVYRVKKLQ